MDCRRSRVGCLSATAANGAAGRRACPQGRTNRLNERDDVGGRDRPRRWALLTRSGHRSSSPRSPRAGTRPHRARTCILPSRGAMRLRGVARNAVNPWMTLFAVSRCMLASTRFGFQRFGIVLPHGEIAKTGLDALGDRDLSRLGGEGQSARQASIHWPGKASTTSFQALASIGSSALGGSGRPLPGSIGTIERSASERRGITRSIPPCGDRTDGDYRAASHPRQCRSDSLFGPKPICRHGRVCRATADGRFGIYSSRLREAQRDRRLSRA